MKVLSGQREIQAKLEANKDKLWSPHKLERTGGEPDVIGSDADTGEYIFCDCSAESPTGRRSVCYDRKALDSRKKINQKITTAELGMELLTEEQYCKLQELASIWVKTLDSIRKLGGAIFCDHRYNTVSMYHNGADSYYAARGFRGAVRV